MNPGTRFMLVALVVAFLALAAGPVAVTAAPITIMIGDNDGFGFGAAAVPDNAPLLNINLGEDRRSAAEAAATDGAQQTDIYSAVIAPLPNTFDVVFTLPDDLESGTLTVDMGGFQASTFGQLAVSFNGVAAPNFFNFEDGAFATRVRQFVLTPAQIANANAANELRITIARGGSNDGIAFDFFQLDAEVVPEPTSLVLFGMVSLGAAGYYGLRRRKKLA